MVNQTAKKFGYPENLLKEYEHWWVLLRQQQVTLGSLVLCSKSDATAYSELPIEAFAEMSGVVKDVERVLASTVRFEKVNYLMLMMVDPNVHYHIFPRYSGSRELCGLRIVDKGWPALPDLPDAHVLNNQERERLLDYFRDAW